MKSLLLALCASFFFAQAVQAEPNGNAYGYWEHGPGSRVAGATVPEPTSMLVFGVGLLAVGISSRRRAR